MASISGSVTIAGDPDDWIACAFDADTHAFAGVATVSAGSYTISGLTAGRAYVVACRPKSGPAWIAGRFTALNDYTVPANPVSTPYLFKATTAASDADLASVVLLLGCNGVNNSQTFTDHSTAGRTVSVTGDAKISTTASQFGGASGYFDGNGDKLTVAASSAWDLGTTYTIEFWAYPSSLPSTGRWCRLFMIGSNATSSALTLQINENGLMQLIVPDTGKTGTATPTGAFTTDGWHHYAFSVSATAAKIYKDGVKIGEGTVTAQTASSSNPLVIGYDTPTSVGYNYAGYLDDVRITKGVARYPNDFTAPAVSFVTLTSATEPTWPTTPGATVADTEITWTNMGQLLDPLIAGPLIAV